MWGSRRWVVGAVTISVAALGVGSVPSCADDGHGDGVSAALGATHTIVGREGLLVVEIATREVVEVGLEGAGARVESRPRIPGSGPLVNPSGAQLTDGRWAVAGNDCSSVETVDPDGCEPGTFTLAVLDGADWSLVDDPPDEFRQSFVSVAGVEGDDVLMARWDAGDSSYWTVDVAEGQVTEVAWRPSRLPLGGEVITDAEMSDLDSTRSACLSDGALVVIEGRPGNAGYATTLTALPAGDDDLTPATVDLALGDEIVVFNLVCAEGEPAYLVGTDRASGEPVAVEVRVDDGTVGRVLVAPMTGDLLLSGVTVTEGAATLTYQAEDAGVSPSAPSEVAMFRAGAWAVSAEADGITSSETAYLPSEPGAPLIVRSADRASYRVVAVD